MSAAAELATGVQRVGVLLDAGVAPSTAWRHAGDGTTLAGWARAAGSAEPGVVAAILGAGPPGPAVAHPEARRAFAGLAATWAVSIEAGAPLAAALRSYAVLLRGFAESERQRRVALSGPIATSRLVLVMPVLGLVLGAALGEDTFGVLLGGPLGWACLVLGGALMGSAWWWNRALLRRAALGDPLAGLVAELVATAMRGGVSAERAGSIVGAAARRFGIPADFRTTEAAIRVASAAGAPVAELLRSEAEEARRSALADAAERVERLSVTLMLPLGVCVLPAFMLLGVVPMIVGIIASTVTAI